jgi:hypothetical protein
MSYWKTRMHLHKKNKLIETKDMERRLTITTAILHLLNTSHRTTEQVEHTIRRTYNKDKKKSHLLYIDDLKPIGKSEEELQKQIQTVKAFSDDIHMEFGLEKMWQDCI